MNKQDLIKAIYTNCPEYSTKINGAGEHIIEFSQERMLIRANLERLSIDKLTELAMLFKLQCVFARSAEVA